MRSLCRALLVLDILYCVLALAQPGLPGWHMFESVERTDHTLTDREGRAVDVRAWLPRGANVVDRGELRRIVSFVCEKEHARAPFTYAEPGGAPVVLGAGGPRDCVMPSARRSRPEVHGPR